MKSASSQGLKRKRSVGLFGAGISAILASICCVVPLVLISIGVSGAWISSLSMFQPYRPIFIGITLIFLALAFYGVYRRPKTAFLNAGAACNCPSTERRNKIILWSVTVLLLGLLIFPTLSPYVFAGRTVTDKAQIKQVVLDVSNMTCASCPVVVKRSLTKLDGVKAATVTLNPPRAVVSYDPGRVSVAELIAATTNAGYPSSLRPGEQL